MKKLAVFNMYNKSGEIPTYIRHLVLELKQADIDIHFVCAEKLNYEARQFLEDYVYRITIFDKSMRDYMAWAEIINKSREEIKMSSYEKIYFLNDKFLGPFCSFCDFEREMDLKCVDTITLNKNILIFYRKLVKDESFFEFWENIRVNRRRKEPFETEFIRYFEDRGFLVKEISDEKLNTKYDIVGKNMFTVNALDRISNKYGTKVEELAAKINQLQPEYQPILNDYLQNTYSPEQLCRILGNNFLVSDREESIDSRKQIGILVWCSDVEKGERAYEYLRNLTDSEIWYISNMETVPEIMKEEGVQKELIHIVNEIDMQLFSILSKYAKNIQSYDYVCLLNLDACQDVEEVDYYFENIAKSNTYIKKILQLFEERSDIGLLLMDYSCYNQQFGNVLKKYRKSNSELREWRRRFCLPDRKTEELENINSNAVWINTKGIANFSESKKEDVFVSSKQLADIEWQMLSEIVQHNGLFVGKIISEMWAQKELADMHLLLNEFVLKNRNGENKEADTVLEFMNKIRKERIVKKKETVIQERLVPIGLKEAFKFYIKKKYVSIWHKITKH